MTATEHVDIDTSSELMAQLQAREPEKSPAELVEDALQFYNDANKPWIALEERERYAEGGGVDA